MTDIKLSKRMQAVAHMVTENSVVDIGCDHAFVSIYLIMSKKAEKVIAMDVNKGPLDIARQNVSSYGCELCIDIRLSNGFEKLHVGEAKVAIIAGMGGPLTVDILKRGKEHTDAGISLVLQPQSDIGLVRQYLYSIDYEIIKEDMLIEDGKYYTLMKAIPATDNILPYSEEEFIFGRCLIKDKHPVLRSYLELELCKNRELLSSLEHIHTEKSILRKKEISDYVSMCECVLENIV